jgi:hypothetical protein
MTTLEIDYRHKVTYVLQKKIGYECSYQVAGWTSGESGFDFRRGLKFLSLLMCQDLLWWGLRC